jgi:hypothetical protein
MFRAVPSEITLVFAVQGAKQRFISVNGRYCRGRPRFASAGDVKAADMNAEAPVGTTLAILERSMKVMSAIQARLHASMRVELRILSGIVRDFGPEKYPYA